MSNTNEPNQYSAHSTVNGLKASLATYIEAQYHVKNPSLIAERKALLEQHEVIAQDAFVEATPVYALGNPYKDLKLPPVVSRVLTDIAELQGNTGLYAIPYHHQAVALEKFFGGEPSDLVIATGTGSGKTESFLMPILGALAQEGAEKRAGRDLHGCRALLLYPMNALVNDQVARIRRLLGNSTVNALVSDGRNRPVRFGSYTGRTPYPGPRSAGKDTSHIEPLFEEYYNKLEGRPEIKKQLEDLGRWPSKDLQAFYSGHLVETKKQKSGKNIGKDRKIRHWGERLKTQDVDRELMIRDEMQRTCPDVLVTNYSMLSYMLMRPIESPLFDQTARWLASDPCNELILVLDEAHMYRGAGGAEVALLIRRLVARLGIARDRVRAILTSASLGEGEQERLAVQEFANDLTGLEPSTGRCFSVIGGRKEKRAAGRVGTLSEAEALAMLDVDSLAKASVTTAGTADDMAQLAAQFNWPMPPANGDIADYLYEQLTGFGPAELLIELVSGRATRLEQLTSELFPDAEPAVARRAVDALLAICSHAKQKKDGRVLVPTRLHLFYRGLPGLYACVDKSCTERLSGGKDDAVLGRFHTKPLLACSCASGARVFDFFTHRDCGAAFLVGWVDDKMDFMWHEPDAASLHDGSRKLVPIECLVEPTIHPTSQVRERWLHIATGRLLDKRPTKNEGDFLFIRVPDKSARVDGEVRFDVCPVCVKKTRSARNEPSKIMDHVTKGEAPFATLVRSQMLHQPASRKWDRSHPNEGRKVLVFSDGRQKAARLARDMPRDMELDLFRQAVAVATRLLPGSFEAKPTGLVLYLAFIATLKEKHLSMFDVDGPRIAAHLATFENDYEGNLAEALRDSYPLGETPWRYRIALLKLLCSSYYSLSGTTVGFVEAASRPMKVLAAALVKLGMSFEQADIKALAVAWIQGLLSEFAFDADYSPTLREKAAGFSRLSWGSDGQFERPFRTALTSRLGFTIAQVEGIEKGMCTALAVEVERGYFLNPNSVKLTIDLSIDWTQCDDCTGLMPLAFRNACLCCGSDKIRVVNPENSPYLRARKRFWREPVERALREGSRLNNLYVEEHTAQLSNRDHKAVNSTTELHELRFQDLLLEDGDLPIDVLSCTTTMEVGIDIGSLVAVALRNVPPQRENYQQRAGRAGRRGSSLSSVVTFSQNGPHDSFYFSHPHAIVAGPPRSPELKIDNEKIAKRHVHAFLLQTYFHDAHSRLGGASRSAVLMKALGPTRGFFHGPDTVPNLRDFEEWLTSRALTEPFPLIRAIADWLPSCLSVGAQRLDEWVHTTVNQFLNTLNTIASSVPEDQLVVEVDREVDESSDGEVSDEETLEHEDLLEFLFAKQLLPTYAFPTSLCSFLIEKRVKLEKRTEVRLEQRPQLSTAQALSEYAPGRLVVVNKKTYRSAGVFASTDPAVVDRAESLFAEAMQLVMCNECSFVQDPSQKGVAYDDCPVCGGSLAKEMMIQPEVFGPENAVALREEDRDQDITYATMAQYPQPAGGESFVFTDEGPYLQHAHAIDRRLFTLNKGQTKDGDALGFSVCTKCGCAEVFNAVMPKSGKHKRPYHTRSWEAGSDCMGEFERTYLGYDFNSDLLLVRIKLAAPLIRDLSSRTVVRTLESASLSISEALRLSASRHKQLDLDPMEFGSGYRLLPPKIESEIAVDIYLYDTLSGGAGYAELAAKYFKDIVEDTLKLLDGCDCDTSCTDCLDHFHNQHNKAKLDRKLGAALLRYALYGVVPQSMNAASQRTLLRKLVSSLELDGFTCGHAVEFSGNIAPLLVEVNGKSLSVGAYPVLLETCDFTMPEGTVGTYYITDRSLANDLPGTHSAIRRLMVG